MNPLQSALLSQHILRAISSLESIAIIGRPGWELLLADLRESEFQAEIMAFMKEELVRYEASPTS